jgi:hypothetical protein
LYVADTKIVGHVIDATSTNLDVVVDLLPNGVVVVAVLQELKFGSPVASTLKLIFLVVA